MAQTTSIRRSTFTVTINSHASPSLLTTVRDIFDLQADSGQRAIFKEINDMPDERIRMKLETHLSPSTRSGFFNSWAVLFSLAWKSIQNPVRFKKTETESSIFTFLPVTTFQNTEQHNLFMKATTLKQLTDGAAVNPLIDNMNGIIIHDLCKKHPAIAQHVMQYLTSFTILPETSAGISWPWKDITKVDSPWYPFAPSDTLNLSVGDICAASVFDAVDGRSIHDMLRSDERGIHIVLRGLPEFCDTLQLLGFKYGMMHNDLHTENVFIDAHTMKLVLIDYGMMTFSNAGLSHEALLQHVQNEKQRNYMYFTSATYDKLIEKHQKALKYRHSDTLYFTHVFDFATLMANIEYEAKSTMENDGNSWDWFDGFFNVRPALIDRMGSHIIVPSSFDVIQKEFVQAVNRIKRDSKMNDERKKGLLYVAEGVFFMAWFLLYIQTDVLRHNVSSSHVKIELDDLAIDEVMYYYFQIYDLSKINPLKIYETFSSVSQNVIANSSCLQKLRGVKPIIGGTKRNQKAGMMMDDTIKLRSNASVADNLLKSMVETHARRVPSKKVPHVQNMPVREYATDMTIQGKLIPAMAGGKKKTAKKNAQSK